MRVTLDERSIDLPDDRPITGVAILAYGLLDATYELFRDPDGPGGVLGPKVAPMETIEVHEGDRFVATPRCTGLSPED